MSDSDFEFAIGTRVRVNQRDDNDSDRIRVGMGGVVVRHLSPRYTYPYVVKFDDFDEAMCRESLDAVDTAPTVFKLQVPEEPAVGSRVRSVEYPSDVFERFGGVWLLEGRVFGESWEELLGGYPGGLELVPEESEFDAAVRWFRENPREADRVSASPSMATLESAAVIVRHVLSEEQK